ncbi:MAG: SH3 domain-containing protein, partial [Thermoflexales bacterium]
MMRMKFHPSEHPGRQLSDWVRWFALAITVVVVSACGGASSAPPKIIITAPEAGSLLTVGQSIAIVSTVEGEAISQVDVLVNNTVYATLKAPDASRGVPNFPVNVPWTPLNAGNFVIQIRAYGPPDNQLLAQSEPLVVTAESLTEPTPLPSPTAVAIPTATPEAAAGQSPAAGAPSEAPSVTVTNEFVNVRTGPGVEYDKIGELRQGQSVAVRGKSQDGKWWQIAFPSGSGGVGWVIGDYVQPNAAASNVPVAAAPPPPQRPGGEERQKTTELLLLVSLV